MKISESSSGLLLFAAAALAIVLENSKTYLGYIYSFFAVVFINSDLHLIINEGFMSFFFLLVGLEIKREILRGKLKDPKVVILPLIGAIGGIILPGLIYFSLNFSSFPNGWAIPVATDIAFTLAVISLLGQRIPYSLKIFLMTLAIIDDIGAILIIAFFYSSVISVNFLKLAGIMLLILLTLNIARVKKISVYMIVGLILWICLWRAGIQPTLAGIVLACFIPLKKGMGELESPLERCERKLLPWVSLFILPLFAFANSAFQLTAIDLHHLDNYIVHGIILGLVLGKQFGIFGSCWLAVKWGLAKLPEDINWALFYGMSILCGVGFTMSLFIGTLAFQDQTGYYLNLVRFSVIVGSVISGVLGVGVMVFSGRGKARGNI